MKLSNLQLNPQQTQAMMMTYEKESMKMEMGSEMSKEINYILSYLNMIIYF